MGPPTSKKRVSKCTVVHIQYTGMHSNPILPNEGPSFPVGKGIGEKEIGEEERIEFNSLSLSPGDAPDPSAREGSPHLLQAWALQTLQPSRPERVSWGQRGAKEALACPNEPVLRDPSDQCQEAKCKIKGAFC